MTEAEKTTLTQHVKSAVEALSDYDDERLGAALHRLVRDFELELPDVDDDGPRAA